MRSDFRSVRRHSSPTGQTEAGQGLEPEVQGELWVFAYGSLMWRPDFPFLARHRARLAGYHRRLCISSEYWRGTPERPGLVLGLDRGGSCVGVAFRVAAAVRDDTLAALRARELVTGVYREATVAVLLPNGTRRPALAYVADRAHVQYAGGLDRTTMLARVRHSTGLAGPNADYVRATYAHLLDLGLADRDLAWLSEALSGPAAVHG